MRYLLALCLVCSSSLYAQIGSIWALDDCERVQRANNSHFMEVNANNLVWQGGQVNIFGARNEVVAFQLVIEAGASGADNVAAYLDSVGSGVNKISNVDWNENLFDYNGRHIESFVASYINVTGRITAGTGFVSSLPGPESYYIGLMPDVLIPSEAPAGTSTKIGGMPFDIPANNNQTVWFDIYIPKGQASGVYSGTIRVTQDGSGYTNIPLVLTVYDFTLSDTTHVYWGGNLHDSRNALSSILGSSYAYNSGSNAMYWEEHLKYAKFFHRHRSEYMLGFLNYNDLDTRGWGNVFTGSAFTSANGYAGPGENVGNKLCFIGTMDHPIAMPISSGPYEATNSWGATTQENWEYESDRWEQWFLDHAPHVFRLRYIEDELPSFDWDGDGLIYRDDFRGANPPDDSSAVHPYVRELASWLMNNPGVGSNLGRMSPEIVWRHNFADATTEKIDGNGAANYMTAHSTKSQGTWTMPSMLVGIHTIAHAEGQFLKPDGGDAGRYENVTETKLLGDSLGYYGGAYPSFGAIACVDVELSAARTWAWVLWRYQQYVDFYWHWDVLAIPARSSYDYWTMTWPRTNQSDGGLGEYNGTLVIPGTNLRYPSSNRGVSGPLATYALKAARRGIQDYEYLWLARERGVYDSTTTVKVVVPRALDDFDASIGYINFTTGNPIQRRGYQVEAVRRVLAEALNGTEGDPTDPPPQGTFTNNGPRVGAGSLTFTWALVSGTATSATLIRPGVADSSVATSGSTGLWVTESGTYSLRWTGPAGSSTTNSSFVVSSTAEELIYNGDFELSDGWSFADNADPAGTYTRITGTPHGGSYHWRSDLPTTYAASPNVQFYGANSTDYRFSLTGGKTYKLSLWVRSSPTTDLRLRIISGTSYQHKGLEEWIVNCPASWTLKETTFVSNATGTESNIYLQLQHAYLGTTWSEANANVDVDDISLQEQVLTDLGAPSITQPEEGWTNVDTSYTYCWTSVENATSYHLQIDDATNFSSPVYDSTGIVDTSLYARNLPYNTTLYARVHATNDYGDGAWSDTVSFTTLTGVLDPPTLMYPTNGVTGESANPLLVWSPDARASLYEVQIALDSTTWYGDTTFTTTSSWAVIGSKNNPALSYTNFYYWRVRCRNTAGAGDWSSVRYFKTGSRIGLDPTKRVQGARY